MSTKVLISAWIQQIRKFFKIFDRKLFRADLPWLIDCRQRCADSFFGIILFEDFTQLFTAVEKRQLYNLFQYLTLFGRRDIFFEFELDQC